MGGPLVHNHIRFRHKAAPARLQRQRRSSSCSATDRSPTTAEGRASARWQRRRPRSGPTVAVERGEAGECRATAAVEGAEPGQLTVQSHDRGRPEAPNAADVLGPGPQQSMAPDAARLHLSDHRSHWIAARRGEKPRCLISPRGGRPRHSRRYRAALLRRRPDGRGLHPAASAGVAGAVPEAPRAHRLTGRPHASPCRRRDRRAPHRRITEPKRPRG